MRGLLASAGFKLLNLNPYYLQRKKQIRMMEFLSSEEIMQKNEQFLQRIILHSYKNVPYYYDLFNKLKLTPNDIKSVKDLEKLPIMNKETVRDNFDKLLSKNIPKVFSLKAETSGSTGLPSLFLRDYTSIANESLYIERFRESAGFHDKYRTLVLRGDQMFSSRQTEPPYWKENTIEKELIMSCYHINKANFLEYKNAIAKFNPQVIYGYPSAISLLANQYRQNNIKPSIKVIFTSSEFLSSNERSIIENTFQCKVYDWYGQVERVCAIGQCNVGSYHIIEDYSITETVSTAYGLELVGTGLYNKIMPLIRYGTKDFVELSYLKCSCGRNHRVVKKLFGRDYGTIFDAKMNQYPSLPIIDIIDISDGILEAQFEQKIPGEIILNVVTTDVFNSMIEGKIAERIRVLTSSDFIVFMKRTDIVPRSKNGKIIHSFYHESE